jgi:hypothetical protein
MIGQLKLAAGVAWACVALASAVPSVNAMIVTTQTGSYAACGPNAYSNNYIPPACSYIHCGYKQQIRLSTTACAQGACSPETDQVYSDQVYSAGRKVATLATTCGYEYIYQLGSCAC